MKAIILAWGFATRLWPLTEKRAKPLLFLWNKEIISHIVKNIPNDIEIIISTNKVFENDFLTWKEKNYWDKNIKIFIEDSENDDVKKWALWAVSYVIKNLGIDEDLIVIAWDNYFWFNFNNFIKSFNTNPIIAAYDIQDKNKARSFWVIISEDWKTVDAFEEKPLNPSSSLVSTWCYIFPKKNLEDIIVYAKEKNDDLGWIFEYLIKKENIINIFVFNEAWFDIWSFDWYINAHKLLQERQVIWKNSKIRNSKINNKTYIQEWCEIENSEIENSIIMKWCKIKNSEIRDSIIDINCNINWVSLVYKVIRENSILSN